MPSRRTSGQTSCPQASLPPGQTSCPPHPTGSVGSSRPYFPMPSPLPAGVLGHSGDLLQLSRPRPADLLKCGHSDAVFLPVGAPSLSQT